MPGDVPHAGVHTLHYIRSESAFSHARTRGALELLRGKLLRRDPYLRSLNQVAGDRRWAVYRGLQDVPLPAIVGSAGRAQEFSRHFHPLTGSERQKERWRHSYTLAMTGTPPAPHRSLPGRPGLLCDQRPPPGLGRPLPELEKHPGPRL